MNPIIFPLRSAVRRCLKISILFSLISSISFLQLSWLSAEECADKGGGGSHQGGTDSGGGGSLNMDMGVDGAMSRPAGMGGDSFGMSGPPDDFSRAASAAMLSDNEAGDPDEEGYEKNRKEIDERYKEEEEARERAEAEKLKAFDEAQAEEAARQERLDKLNKEGLERDRQNAQHELERMRNSFGNDPSKWTDEQHQRYDQAEQKYNELMQPTEQEAKDIERRQAVHDQVTNDIRKAAGNMGGTSAAEVQERRDRANMSNASTQTWRSATFTGKMVNEVQQDTFNQRERGIRANNMIIAADLYLQNPNLTPEQREIAQQVKDRALGERGAAADAISKNAALVLGGAAGDVATLGAGRIAGRIGTAVSNALRGETAAAGAAGAVAGETVAAGENAAARTGTTVAAGEGAAARTGGTVAAGEGAAAGGAKPLSQMTPSEVQAAHDANAARQAGQAWRSGQPMPNPGDSVVMPVESAVAAAETNAIRASASELSQSQVNALFKPGANLTPTQVIQKAELLTQGYRPGAGLPGAGAAPPVGVPPGMNPGMSAGAAEGATVTGAQPFNPGAAAGGATQGFNKVLPVPGQGVAPGVNPGISAGASEAPTLVGMKPFAPGAAPGVAPGVNPGMAAGASESATVTGLQGGGQAAAGGTTQAFNKVLSVPGQGVAPGVNPGMAAGASESATVTGIQGGGQAASGGTQAFNKVLPVPGQGANTGTQAFNQVLPVPGQGAATAGGGGTQAFNQVLTPVPQQGAARAATAASESPTVVIGRNR